jgi:hypothetical protein
VHPAGWGLTVGPEWEAVRAAVEAQGVRVMILRDAPELVQATAWADGWDAVDWDGTGWDAPVENASGTTRTGARTAVRFATDSTMPRHRYGDADPEDTRRGWLLWTWLRDADERTTGCWWDTIGYRPWWAVLLHEAGHAAAGPSDWQADAWGLDLARELWGEGSPQEAVALESMEVTLAVREHNAPRTIEEAVDRLERRPPKEAIAAARAVLDSSDRDHVDTTTTAEYNHVTSADEPPAW